MPDNNPSKRKAVSQMEEKYSEKEEKGLESGSYNGF